MAMSDCSKCWETPCVCGHDYMNMTEARRMEIVEAALPAGYKIVAEQQLADGVVLDAQRYRWLRENIGKTVSHWFCTEGGEELDEQIDIALSKQKGKTDG